MQKFIFTTILIAALTSCTSGCIECGLVGKWINYCDGMVQVSEVIITADNKVVIRANKNATYFSCNESYKVKRAKLTGKITSVDANIIKIDWDNTSDNIEIEYNNLSCEYVDFKILDEKCLFKRNIENY